LNFRVARERKGAAAKLLQRVWPRGRDLPWNTLVFSGPGGGKTTLLRDLARQLSIKGLAVGIVDERSELAACYRGEPAHDVGPRTDVLDGCPKAEGMRMLLRSMGPQVLVTDELGQASDAAAVHEARTSGVSVITSAHAGSMDELRQRPVLSDLMEAELFECFIQLSAQPHPGTVCSVENPEETPV
jgi:stage III sporulation protein AA